MNLPQSIVTARLVQRNKGSDGIAGSRKIHPALAGGMEWSEMEKPRVERDYRNYSSEPLPGASRAAIPLPSLF